MIDITPDTWGWTMKSWHKSGGCVGSWHPTLTKAFKEAKDWEDKFRNKDEETQTSCIEFIHVQYKDRMSV